MSNSRLSTLGIAALLLATAGCGGGLPAVTPIDPNPSGLPTLGEIEQMIQASNDKDTDGDYIPDEIERDTLKTNPNDRDTDRDGLPDNYEIFGEGIYDYGDFVPDEDKDAIIAARDHDDNNDKINDGRLIDTDGDTIPNYLEYYGYVYDWLTGRFVSCEDVNCTGQTIYKTDPLQRSTDQDPYPDDVEVSGLHMDPSVVHPGMHPLVPACPTLFVELMAYTVTLNEDITYGRGGSISQGTTWTRETTRTHSQTTEHSWDIGVTLGIGFEGKKVTGSAEVSTNYGVKWGSTNETSHSVSRGDSIVNEANWSESRSVNPTEAAHVKLMLKARNFGEACMSNVVPTLTMKVAGMNVATFEPGNAAITLIPPGGTYPTNDGVYWVVDTDANGDPITLTMNELRAFESGAPVSISVTQTQADVLRLGEDGSWETLGDSTEFATRCDAQCADIFLDMGDGSVMHETVFCGEEPSEPVVTFGDALAWCADGYEDKDGLWITCLDKEGIPQTVNLMDWRFVFDRDTMILNGIDPDDMANTIPPDFRLSQLRLHAGSQIFGKAPRDPQLPKPAIHYAYLNYDQRRAHVCATDYQGIDEVVIAVTVDPGDGSVPVDYEWPMTEYTEDAMIFTHEFSDTEWDIVEEVLERQMDPASGSKDVIKVVVRSIIGESSERPFGLVPPNPRAVAPIIDFVRVDLAAGWIYARVRPNESYPETWHQTYPVDWVKAFHAAFEGGVIELVDPPDRYQDPYGYIGTLPKGWSSKNAIKLVGWVAPGVYTEREVDPAEFSGAYNQGNAEFHLQYGHGLGQGTWINKNWAFDWLDLDDPNATPGGTIKMSGDWLYPAPHDPSKGAAVEPGYTGWIEDWAPSEDIAEFYARYNTVSGHEGWRIFFYQPFYKVTAQDAKTFKDVTAVWAESRPRVAATEGQAFEKDDIWVLDTNDGRLAKIVITEKKKWDKSAWYYFFGAKYGKECKFSFRYVVFDKTEVSITADTYVIYDKDKMGKGITLDGSSSKGDYWHWQKLSGPQGGWIEDATEEIARLHPANKGDGLSQEYEIELIIDEGLTQEVSTKVIIKVVYPTAKIDSISSPVEFDPGDARRLQLWGNNSIGARKYDWEITDAPDMIGTQEIENPTTPNPVFIPDEEGTYKVKLTINKGETDEHEREVQFTVEYK